MLSIKPNNKWKEFSKLFSDILVRYDWFLFEFSKQFTIKAKRHLLDSIKEVQGSKDYRRRVVVAEYRSRGASWFALAVKARTLSQTNMDSVRSLIYVVSTNSITGSNPAKNILESRNPWTLDTLPFVPSQRQAIVTVKKASDKLVQSTERRRLSEMSSVSSEMKLAGVEFQTRSYIMSKLKIVPELEQEINKMEFDLGKKHWGPAIRKAKLAALRQLMSDRHLLSVMTNCNFNKYRNKKHLRQKMRLQDVRQIYNFQKKVTRAMAN